MRLMICGGDARMLGAWEAAKRAGWEAESLQQAGKAAGWYDAALLPWPHSFTDGRLAGTEMTKEQTLELLPPCGLVLHGGGVTREELACARSTFDPVHDEAFLRANAKLTAEGAIARAMGRQGRALLGCTCVITGFGRIGQELAARLVALEAFVVVCARSELQMRRAHDMGAHPLPLDRLAKACEQADVVFNTVPARIFPAAVLARLGEETLLIDLASAPYGADPETARRMRIHLAIEGGLPGRYAPMEAGAALFEAIQRRLSACRQEEEGDKTEQGTEGKADG